VSTAVAGLVDAAGSTRQTGLRQGALRAGAVLNVSATMPGIAILLVNDFATWRCQGVDRG
jgi:hypothetical protein